MVNIDPLLKVLGDSNKPGPLWHQIYGETGKTALIWSLCKYRDDSRLTVIAELSDPWNYETTCRWAGYPKDQVLIVSPNVDILAPIVQLCATGDVGQVIFENLGFLVGGGRMLPEVEQRLGDVSLFFELSRLGELHNIAFYTTSYEIPNLKSVAGMDRKIPLGGNLLANLCSKRRLRLERICYLARYGLRVGERISATNVLTGMSCTLNVWYERGPAVVRLNEV